MPITKENAKEMQRLATESRVANANARRAFNDALTKEPELIAKLIGSNSEQLASTKLGGEWLLNSAQEILVQSILEQQKQAHKLELEQLKADLKSTDVLEIKTHPDLGDEKRVWSFDELANVHVMSNTSSRQLLALFSQNKSDEPPVDEQNRLLSIWQAFNGN
ncbi:hypothetical protein BCU85_17380 [Vibrio lentus]|uniref:hypothetical protein n=1 Tax=Vibrio TaxID=662 RepID=UPI000C85BA46|nr:MULTISPECIES: hypothetical protein [Vibrio]MCC4818032.1 hypothetical protein [Vibrio lentus]PME61934.1 hypothetical protein BCV33_21310 [Vibrio lentus]PMG72969.1 hypothetical protein BCU85_17380 [Vibrio lentus]PMK89917.1 hypothetical protein BCT88_21345 [Vibrio lentus]PML25481.1 hypothetical protein BCT80_19525 [Vibrio lentus]